MICNIVHSFLTVVFASQSNIAVEMTSSKYFDFGLGIVSKGNVIDESFGLLYGDGALDIPDSLFGFDCLDLIDCCVSVYTWWASE